MNPKIVSESYKNWLQFGAVSESQGLVFFKIIHCPFLYGLHKVSISKFYRLFTNVNSYSFNSSVLYRCLQKSVFCLEGFLKQVPASTCQQICCQFLPANSYQFLPVFLPVPASTFAARNPSKVRAAKCGQQIC